MKSWFLLLLGLAAFSCHRAQPDFKATKRLCGDDADAHAFHYLQLPDMAGDEAPIAFAGINPNIQTLRITSRRCVEIPQDLPPSTVVMGSVTGPRNLAFYFRLEDVPDRTIPLMDTSRWTLESDCQNLGTILGRTDETQLHYHATIPHLEEASRVTATLADSNRTSIQTEAGWMADAGILTLRHADAKAGLYTLKIAIKSYLQNKTIEQECSVQLDGKAPNLALNIDQGLGLMKDEDASPLASFEPGFALKVSSDETIVSTEYCLRPAAGGAARCQTLDGSTPYPIPESGVWTLAIKARDAAGWVSSRELTFISYEETKIDLLEARIKESMQRFDKGEQLAALTDLLQLERSRRAFTTERERQVLLPRIKEALMHMAVAVNLQGVWINAAKSTRCRIIPADSETVVCVENHNGDQALVFRNIQDGREIKRYPTAAGDNFQLLIPKSSPVVIFRDSRNTLTRYDWQNNIVSTEEKRIDTWNAIGVSDDGRYVSALLADKFLWLWDWTDATHPKVTQLHEAPGLSNVAIRIGPDARLIFATSGADPGRGLVLSKDENGYHKQSFQDWHDIQFSITQGLFLARTQFAVSLYRLSDLSLVDRVDYYSDHYSSVFYADWSADGKSIEVLRKYGAGYSLLTFGWASLKTIYRDLMLPFHEQNRNPSHLDLKVVISPDSEKVALISDNGMTLWKLDPKGFDPPTELTVVNEKVLSSDYEGIFLGEKGTFFYKSYDQFRSYGLTKGLLNSINGWAQQVAPGRSHRYNIATNASWGIYDADTDQLTTHPYPDGMGSMPPLVFPDERLVLSGKTEVGGVALWFNGDIVVDSDTLSHQFESSPDGNWAAVIVRDVSPPEIELWDIRQRKIAGRFPGRFCFVDNTGLLLKHPTQGPVRLDFQSMEIKPSPSSLCSYFPGTPFQWNGETAVVGAGHAIQSVWTDRTLVPAVTETSEANRVYLRRDFDGKHFVDLFRDQNADFWLQVNQHTLPISASVSAFSVYPDFILTGNPYFGALADASELIETKGFTRVRVPGKLMSGTIVSQKTGSAVMPMYFPAEDVTRFIPYDLDRLLQKACDYLQSKPIKIEGDICLIP